MSKSSIVTTTTILSMLALSCNGFNIPQSHNVISSSNNHRSILSTQLLMSSSTETEMTEVEKLRAAAAKAREEYQELSKAMGKEVDAKGDITSPDTVQPKNLSVGEVEKIANSMNFGTGDASSQTQKLNALMDVDLKLFNKVVFEFLKTTDYPIGKLDEFPLIENDEIIGLNDVFQILEESGVGVPAYYKPIEYQVEIDGELKKGTHSIFC